jgi:hypothetical protein
MGLKQTLKERHRLLNAKKTYAAPPELGLHPSSPGAYAPVSAASRFWRSSRQELKLLLESRRYMVISI